MKNVKGIGWILLGLAGLSISIFSGNLIHEMTLYSDTMFVGRHKVMMQIYPWLLGSCFFACFWKSWRQFTGREIESKIESKVTTIKISRIMRNEVQASIVGDKDFNGELIPGGITPAEALGELIIQHADKLNITLEVDSEFNYIFDVIEEMKEELEVSSNESVPMVIEEEEVPA